MINFVLFLAKNPLVICVIYLLHFYKCEDKLNKVQDMRNILQKKYNYELAEWSETTILDQFRTSIMEIRGMFKFIINNLGNFFINLSLMLAPP